MREGDFSLSTDESSSAHNRDVGQFPCPINAVYNLIRLHSRLGQTSDSLLRSFLKMFVLFCDRVDEIHGIQRAGGGAVEFLSGKISLASIASLGSFLLRPGFLDGRLTDLGILHSPLSVYIPIWCRLVWLGPLFVRLLHSSLPSSLSCFRANCYSGYKRRAFGKPNNTSQKCFEEIKRRLTVLSATFLAQIFLIK